MSGLSEEIAFPDTMIRIRPNLSRVTTKFLNIMWNSDYIRRQIEASAKTTAGIWKISQTDIESIEVIAPPLPEQTEIVSRVETLFSFADQIEAHVKAAQAQANKLTQSILAKAFRGELTAEWRVQHPELISGENSAEALLARIQAERVKTDKPAKSRNKKKEVPVVPVADDLPAGQLSLPGLILPKALEAGR